MCSLQELFSLERRHTFLKFAEMLLAQSGGIFEVNRFARPCEVSRTTISNYLSILEATFVVHVIGPYSTHRPTEIVSVPKVYAFDTGLFVIIADGLSYGRKIKAICGSTSSSMKYRQIYKHAGFCIGVINAITR